MPTMQSPRHNGFTTEYYKNVRENLMSIFLKVFNEIERAVLPHSFTEASITLIAKLHSDLFNEHGCKDLQDTGKQNATKH